MKAGTPEFRMACREATAQEHWRAANDLLRTASSRADLEDAEQHRAVARILEGFNHREQCLTSMQNEGRDDQTREGLGDRAT